MKPDNQMKLSIKAISINEGFARSCVGAFVAQIDPTIEQLDDLKTAVSEAVTNAIVHGYADNDQGNVEITCSLIDKTVTVEIVDFGKGISNISQAMQPFFSTVTNGDRAGMGFAVMQAFCDKVDVFSSGGITKITLTKNCE